MTTLVWGIKESLREYISNIPDGEIKTSNGASFTEEGLFAFTADAEQTSDDNENTLRFSGTVELSGYRGMLSVTLSDPMLKVTATQVTLSVTPPHQPRSSLILATSNTPPPLPVPKNQPMTVQGLELTSAGAAIFEFNYPLGASLDPAYIA